jgi:hypothetical protein
VFGAVVTLGMVREYVSPKNGTDTDFVAKF